MNELRVMRAIEVSQNTGEPVLVQHGGNMQIYKILGAAKVQTTGGVWVSGVCYTSVESPTEYFFRFLNDCVKWMLCCPTCGGTGWIGGPSYQQPDEGGECCPDCHSEYILRGGSTSTEEHKDEVIFRYMRDNFTFKKLSHKTEEALKEIQKEFDKGFTSGSLVCSDRKFKIIHCDFRNKEKFIEECRTALEAARQQPIYKGDCNA